MPSFGLQSIEELKGCDIRLQIIANTAIKYVNFKVVKGHRNEKDQNAAFDAGLSEKRWPDGNHNSVPSRAMDVAPGYFDKGFKINWEDVCAFARLAGFLEAVAYRAGIKVRLGMDWDGDWRTAGKDPGEYFLDIGHIEVIG